MGRQKSVGTRCTSHPVGLVGQPRLRTSGYALSDLHDRKSIFSRSTVAS
jgi:hypothetical protein